MARRSTSPSNKQMKARTTASAKTSEPIAAEAPRRGRKAKSTTSEPAEPSLTGIFVPGGEEPAETGAEIGSSLPVKARRARKLEAHSDKQAPPSLAAENSGRAESPPPELTQNSDGEPLTVETDSSSSPSASPRRTRRRRNTHDERQPEASMNIAAASQPMQQAAARWDADTGTATFDWPSIEQVAAADGPNQTMAKLLLAARAEGANSRWPF